MRRAWALVEFGCSLAHKYADERHMSCSASQPACPEKGKGAVLWVCFIHTSYAGGSAGLYFVACPLKGWRKWENILDTFCFYLKQFYATLLSYSTAQRKTGIQSAFFKKPQQFWKWNLYSPVSQFSNPTQFSVLDMLCSIWCSSWARRRGAACQKTTNQK